MAYIETEKIELKKALNETFEKEVVAFLNTLDGNVMNSKNEHSNENVGVNVGVKLNKTQQLIYTLIMNNPNMTYFELAIDANKSAETIRRNLKSLVSLNLIKRVGSDKNGHWEIIK